MNEQNDYTEMEYPYYPTGSRHQKAIVIKVNAMVPILPGEEFKTAGKRDEINKILHDTLVEKINTCIKAFEDAGLIDKATVGEDDKNTHKSTEPAPVDTSTPPPNDPPPHNDIPIELTEPQLKLINGLTNPTSYIYRDLDAMKVSMAVSRRNEILGKFLHEHNLTSHAQLSKRQAMDLITILKAVEV